MEIVKYQEDLNQEEKKALAEFKRQGLPGINNVTDDLVFQWFQLYMSGKTYGEIAEYTKIRKDYVIYMSDKGKWYDKKIAYYKDISETLFTKLKNARVESANTVSTIIASLNKYYGDKFNKFLTTNDPELIEKLDQKLLTNYYKSIDILDKVLMNSNANPEGKLGKQDKSKPIVNVNINGNAKIEQTDDENLDITTEEAVDAADLLKALAKYKKDQKK